MDLWLYSLLSVLGVWRITHLISMEDGPWEIFSRLRRRAGSRSLGRMLHCFYCLSVWVALPFAAFGALSYSQRFVAWWAFSGGATLLERATQDGFDVKIEN